MQSTPTVTASALSPAAQIVEIADRLGGLCPLCGKPGLDSRAYRERVVTIECKAKCDGWSVARALLPRLTEAGVDPAPMWDTLEQLERRGTGDSRPALPFRSAYEFAQDTPPELTMLVDGLIAHGTMTEFLAAPKAGKTTLLMAAIAAVLGGRDFLGRRTRRVPVFFFTEENPPTFREALRRAGLIEARDLYMITKRQTEGATLDSLIPRAMAFARRFTEPGLIVVDTLAKFAGFEDDEENTSGAARVALEPLEAAAAAGFAVLYTRHDRKGGGSLVEAGRGSSTFAGTADVLLGLRRAEGRGASNRRTLSGIGRIDGLPEHLVIEYADGEYRVVGEGASAVSDNVHVRILEILSGTGDQFILTPDLKAQLNDVSATTVTNALAAMVTSGAIEKAKKLGPGAKTNGYRIYQTP